MNIIRCEVCGEILDIDLHNWSYCPDCGNATCDNCVSSCDNCKCLICKSCHSDSKGLCSDCHEAQVRGDGTQ